MSDDDDPALGRRSVLAALSGVTAGCAGQSNDTATTQPTSARSTATSAAATTPPETPPPTEPAAAYPPDEYDIDEPTIAESVWIETGTDTDGTGRSDRVEVYIVRPKSPSDGLPAVVRADPYDIASKPVNLSGLDGLVPPDGPTDAYGEFAVELFVPDERPSGRRTMSQRLWRLLGQSISDVSIGSNVLTVPGVNDSLRVLSDQRANADNTGVADAGDTSLAETGTTESTDVDERQPGLGFSEKIRRAYVQLFVPEGYAYVDVSPVGTGRSTGCNGLGNAAEAASVTATIDWLNNRRPAYTERDANTTSTANWASGDAGMIGQSYLGTIQNNVATTGVDGLKTIVPKASRVSRYLGQRSHGTVVVGGPTPAPSPTIAAKWTTGVNKQRCRGVLDRLAEGVDWATGNFNEYWADREYVAEFDAVEASVLLVHTLRDYTQSPRQLSVYADALREHDIPHRMWVGQGDHGAVPNLRTTYPDRWSKLLLKWFDYWVADESNGVMDGPTAIVETTTGRLAGEDTWPAPRSEPVSVGVRPGDPFGELVLDGGPTEPTTERFVDDSNLPPSTLVTGEPTTARVAYRTASLDGPVRISGTVVPQLAISADSEAALCSVALVEYPLDGGPQIISRGWLNLLNRDSRRKSEPLEPGKQYDVSFELNPTEHVFPAGSQLGIVIYSSDRKFTKRPPSSPTLTVHLDETTVKLPVVDGRSGLTAPPENPDTLYGNRPFD